MCVDCRARFALRIVILFCAFLNFDDNQITATKDAGTIAGFKAVYLIDELIAACMANGLHKEEKNINTIPAFTEKKSSETPANTNHEKNYYRPRKRG